MSCPHAVYVDPVKDLGASLLDVEKPGRYCGGEYGRLAKRGAPLQALIAFPDLYEIGMSNQAMRIIYNGLNNIPGISCDRAFAPAPDFERLLKAKGLPLYGLDTGVSLKSLDLLLFTLGYELGFSGVLSMLDASGIPLRGSGRGACDPLVIAGGPAVSNPLPYSGFIDAFWIGEAEAGFFELAAELLEIKQNNARGAASGAAGRAAMLERMREHPSIWMKGKDRARRAVYAGFSSGERPPAVFPAPSMKTVQHHGMLEIMRGCPNGCRFCHAGFWYRPMRQKNGDVLVREAEAFVSQGGYREISLSSLSSGDFSGIGELVDVLNRRFSGRHVSFQLPSLKVSTFSLSLLEKISQTRRSGLTFAVETPLDFWQLSVNKQVSGDSVVEILREAKRNGWRGAKFYFMIGLPLPEPPEAKNGGFSEEEEIAGFICDIARRSGMHFNINIGIFVPKPHTPWQWVRQMDSETAAKKLEYVRTRLKSRGHRVSVSDPLTSTLEGILSRGDERAGDLVEQAYLSGSRLDAWQEYIARDAWRDILEKNSALADEFLSARDGGGADSALPWGVVQSGVSPVYLRREFEKSGRGEMTGPCAAGCLSPCGCCIPRAENLPYSRAEDNSPAPPREEIPGNSKSDPAVWRLLFSFTKEGGAVFHGHLSLIEIFSMAMIRAGLDVLYTLGFNPLVKLEIAAPLSTGISAGAEIAAADFPREISPAEFAEKMNGALPDGIRVNRAECYKIPAGGKKHSLSSLLWGFGYGNAGGETDYVPAREEKAYRLSRAGKGETLFSLRRACVLAKDIAGGGALQGPVSYFDVYRAFYPNH